jgi:hypothetical protein
MRLRFAQSGHASKVEVFEKATGAEAQASETKRTESGTADPDATTNNEAKIEAATGGQ